jgi:imidazolonepropionase-like amidohydrolase
MAVQALIAAGAAPLTAAVAPAVALVYAVDAAAQQEAVQAAPDRRAGEGEGPFERLIIRGATLIDGTGSPPIGPVDIVVEQNRIAEIRSVGFPGAPIREEGRPEGATREIDATGQFVLPGFVDMHAHIGGSSQGTPAEYVFKLWMGHGITTIRDPGSGNGLDWVLEHKARSERNEIVAPRIHAYAWFGRGWDRGPVETPEAARAWVRWVAEQGGDGLKLPSLSPDVMEATLSEANRLGLGTTAHLNQLRVAQMNVLDAARLGLSGMEHWYGLPEAMFVDRTLQDFRLDYNYTDEQHRFGEAGRLWLQAAEPGSERWTEVMDELIDLGFNIDPTMTIYEASRDLVREIRQPWHEDYTLPSLWQFFQPSREAHGSYWFYWTTEDEVAWKNNYRRWMRFLNDYKNRGGHVTVGSDAGFIFKVYGFGYVRELELLREAGFHPLEVIRSATLWGAQELGRDDVGVVRPGALADIVITELNPLENLKVLYGTGAPRLKEGGGLEWVGGVRYTIKDGVIYDARQLLADVRAIVAAAEGAETASE